MKKILIIIPCLLLLVSSSCSEKRESAKIINVHDGDTFYTNNLTLRLYGVDTPEITNDFFSASSVQEMYGEHATNFAKEQLFNRDVIIQRISVDKYNRQVAKIFINGKDFATSLLENGMAIVRFISITPKNPFFTSDFNYYKQLLEAQLEGFKNKVGIWSTDGNIKNIFPTK